MRVFTACIGVVKVNRGMPIKKKSIRREEHCEKKKFLRKTRHAHSGHRGISNTYTRICNC